MVNVNPVGVFGFGEDQGQFTPITGNNVPVNTALQNLQLGGVQGFTGAIGLTGFLGIIGNTGASILGTTGPIGFQGITGTIGSTGLMGGTGLTGATGSIFNETGLQGITGEQGHTGIAGITGLRGITGFVGLIGHTGIIATGILGLTGASPQGITGLAGSTGIQGTTGSQGITGVAFIGATGIQGVTGIGGVTGLQGTLTLTTTVQNDGQEISYIIPANTITTTGQQLEFYASGLTAAAFAASVISISIGGVTVYSELRNTELSQKFSIEGLIIKQNGNNQEIGIKLLYDGTSGTAARASTTLNMASTQTLTISATSTGEGALIQTLILRRISAPNN